MKIPLLLINDVDEPPFVEVVQPERFDPLVLLYRCEGRKVSEWNILAPDGHRLGHFCVGTWEGNSFHPVVDFDQIPNLVRACGYDARITTNWRFWVNHQGIKKEVTFYIDRRAPNDLPSSIIYDFLRGYLGCEEFGRFVLEEEPMFVEWDYMILNDIQKEKWPKVYDQDGIVVLFSEHPVGE